MLFVTLRSSSGPCSRCCSSDQEMEQAAKSLGASNWQTFAASSSRTCPGIPLRRRARVREGGRRVRLARDHHGQPPLQDAGLVGLHLQPDRERRPRRAPRSRSSCSRSRSGCCSRSARSVTTRRGTTVTRSRAQVRPAPSPSATWRRSSSGRSRSSSTGRSRTASAPPGTLSTPETVNAFKLTLIITAIAVPLNTIFGIVRALRSCGAASRGKGS